MAREGKKLELYEILAAKRAKGKMTPGFDPKNVRQANALESELEAERQDTPERTVLPGVIVDDAVSEAARTALPAPETQFSAPPRVDSQARRVRERQVQERPLPEPEPEPRPRSAREVVFALDTAFIFFTVVLALIGSSYFLGYKRGQEERPAALAGLSEIENSDPARLNLRQLSAAPRATMRPPEQDFTLILRTEPATDDLPERLELELAEAVSRGRQAGGGDIQGFIFRTGGNDPRYVLSVGLGRTANDTELNKLLQIYNRMEGMTLSREPRPYIGCRIAPIRELGAPVY